MSGFANPILGGGGALVYPSIHSQNFVTGISGYTINKDGSAEFNNLTIRGTFFGLNYILNSSGWFFYTGVPAAGNLILSIASVAGSDSFGNAYTVGATWGLASTVQVQLSTGANPAGSGIFQFLLNDALAKTPPAMFASVNAGGGGTYFEYDLVGAARILAGHVDLCYVGLLSSDSVSSAVGRLTYLDAVNVPHVYLGWDAAGAHLIGDSTAITPGTGTVATPATAETWHSPTLPTGITGTLRYRMMSDNTLLIQARCSVAATVAAGTLALFTLPAGWRPASEFRGACAFFVNGTPATVAALSTIVSMRFQVVAATGVTDILGFPGGAANTGVTEVNGTWLVPMA